MVLAIIVCLATKMEALSWASVCSQLCLLLTLPGTISLEQIDLLAQTTPITRMDLTQETQKTQPNQTFKSSCLSLHSS